MGELYENLDIQDRLRVNAAIIDGIASGESDGLNALRRYGSSLDSNDPRAGLQTALDGMRDTLAARIDELPALAPRDPGVESNATRDIGRQREFLRTALGEFSQELRTGAYHSPDYYEIIREGYADLRSLTEESPFSLDYLVQETQMQAILQGTELNLAGVSCVIDFSPNEITVPPNSAGAERSTEEPCR